MRRTSFAGASGVGDEAMMPNLISVRCSNRLPLVALFSCIGMGLFGWVCTVPVQSRDVASGPRGSGFARGGAP